MNKHEIYKLTIDTERDPMYIVTDKATVEEVNGFDDETWDFIKEYGYTTGVTFYVIDNHDSLITAHNSNFNILKAIKLFKLKQKLKTFLND